MKFLYFLPVVLLAACTTSAPNPEYAENLKSAKAICQAHCDGDYDTADITLGMGDFGIQSADRNGDGVYDAADVRIAMAEFEIVEAGACPADTNGDGAVDGQDLAAVLANWGLACGP